MIDCREQIRLRCRWAERELKVPDLVGLHGCIVGESDSCRLCGCLGLDVVIAHIEMFRTTGVSYAGRKDGVAYMICV